MKIEIAQHDVVSHSFYSQNCSAETSLTLILKFRIPDHLWKATRSI